MSLEAELERVREVLESADRVKELMEKREQLQVELFNLTTELARLINYREEPEYARANQKCPMCGSTEHNARFHKEQ